MTIKELREIIGNRMQTLDAGRSSDDQIRYYDYKWFFEQLSKLEEGETMESQALAKQEPEGTIQVQDKQEMKRSDIQDQITALIPLAGTIELTKEQEEIIYAPVDELDVEIRPDGLIYLPWMFYVTRLRKAFGMSWSLIPYGPPKRVGNFIHWAFWLIIKGKPYAFAVGEQQYFEGDRMTYGDALEGAKSNALMRLCKGLGISLELWQPEFRRKWLPKYAESFPAVDGYGKPKLDKFGKQKSEWRKKGTVKAEEESPEPEQNHKEFKPLDPPRETKKPATSFLDVMDRELQRLGDATFLKLLGGNGYEKIGEITDRKKQEAFYRIVCGYPTPGARDPGDES